MTRVSVELVDDDTDTPLRLGYRVGTELSSRAGSTTRDIRFRLRLDTPAPTMVVSTRDDDGGLNLGDLGDLGDLGALGVLTVVTTGRSAAAPRGPVSRALRSECLR